MKLEYESENEIRSMHREIKSKSDLDKVEEKPPQKEEDLANSGKPTNLPQEAASESSLDQSALNFNFGGVELNNSIDESSICSDNDGKYDFKLGTIPGANNDNLNKDKPFFDIMDENKQSEYQKYSRA